MVVGFSDFIIIVFVQTSTHGAFTASSILYDICINIDKGFELFDIWKYVKFTLLDDLLNEPVGIYFEFLI